MPSADLKFRLTEATRLIKAALAAGLHIRRVTTDASGRPVLITDENAADSDCENPLDRVLKDAAHKDRTS